MDSEELRVDIVESQIHVINKYLERIAPFNKLKPDRRFRFFVETLIIQYYMRFQPIQRLDRADELHLNRNDIIKAYISTLKKSHIRDILKNSSTKSITSDFRHRLWKLQNYIKMKSR